MIPTIIHQTWKDFDIPPRFRAAQESWRTAHPGWTYRFWTDEDLLDLVVNRAPELAPLYRSYPDAIQRVDAARYVIMREFGGLYADLDVHCVRSFEDLRGHPAVLPQTRPLGFSNQLMLSVPGHPLFHDAVEALPSAFARWQRPWIPRHFRVLTTTGPLFITGRYRAMPQKDGVRVLSLDEHGHGDAAEAYVRHIQGDTWAEWDSDLFNFLMHRWGWLAAGGAAAASLLLLD